MFYQRNRNPNRYWARTNKAQDGGRASNGVLVLLKQPRQRKVEARKEEGERVSICSKKGRVSSVRDQVPLLIFVDDSLKHDPVASLLLMAVTNTYKFLP